jgi:hypothetical protein
MLEQLLEWKLAVVNYCLNVPNLLMFIEENAFDMHYVGRVIVTVGDMGNI